MQSSGKSCSVQLKRLLRENFQSDSTNTHSYLFSKHSVFWHVDVDLIKTHPSGWRMRNLIVKFGLGDIFEEIRTLFSEIPEKTRILMAKSHSHEHAALISTANESSLSQVRALVSQFCRSKPVCSYTVSVISSSRQYALVSRESASELSVTRTSVRSWFMSRACL